MYQCVVVVTSVPYIAVRLGSDGLKHRGDADGVDDGGSGFVPWLVGCFWCVDERLYLSCERALTDLRERSELKM